jgi:hypothetical protein
MKKVAVFGNAGGGKSTLSQRLADMTGLPWVSLDSLQYQPGGDKVPHAEFKAAHDALLQQDQWVVDGFGSMDTLWKRLDTCRYPGVSRYARVAALLVGHKTIPARGLGATCGLAGGQFVMAGARGSLTPLSGCAIPN